MQTGNHSTGYDLELLTVSEVASCLKVSRSLVYHLVESGRLSACRVGRGGAIRVAKHDLLLYVDACRTKTGEPAVQPPRRHTKLKHLRM